MQAKAASVGCSAEPASFALNKADSARHLSTNTILGKQHHHHLLHRFPLSSFD